jgi:hypothetical protein
MITYSRRFGNHGKFQVSQVGSHYSRSESVIRPFRVPSTVGGEVPNAGRHACARFPMQIVLLRRQKLQPEEMEILVTVRALKGAQIELRSLTSESWTEPRKWK